MFHMRMLCFSLSKGKNSGRQHKIFFVFQQWKYLKNQNMNLGKKKADAEA